MFSHLGYAEVADGGEDVDEAAAAADELYLQSPYGCMQHQQRKARARISIILVSSKIRLQHSTRALHGIQNSYGGRTSEPLKVAPPLSTGATSLPPPPPLDAGLVLTVARASSVYKRVTRSSSATTTV